MKVTYSDSGKYECDVTMGPLSRKALFELVVEGKTTHVRISIMGSQRAALQLHLSAY